MKAPKLSMGWQTSAAMATAVLLATVATVQVLAHERQPVVGDAAIAAVAVNDSLSPPDMSVKDIAIAAQTGTRVTILKDATRLSAVDVKERANALAAATSAIQMLHDHPVRAASLARVTVDGYGVASGQDEGSKTEQVQLLIKDRILWVVQIADVDVPAFGRGRFAGEVDNQVPQTGRSDMLVLVDPVGMKPLRIESLVADTPEVPGPQSR